MEAKRIAEYQPFIDRIEEPIREIIPAIWQLPFVLDTGHTCSGHILERSGQSSTRYSKEFGWYPHRATLQIAFSEDPHLLERRDQFRADLRAVRAVQKGMELFFHDIRGVHQAMLPYIYEFPAQNLNEIYEADLPSNLEKNDHTVQEVELLLTSFWEKVADVVRKYNPEASIGPITGKNFRKVINIDNWRAFMPRNSPIGVH